MFISKRKVFIPYSHALIFWLCSSQIRTTLKQLQILFASEDRTSQDLRSKKSNLINAKLCVLFGKRKAGCLCYLLAPQKRLTKQRAKKVLLDSFQF